MTTRVLLVLLAIGLGGCAKDALIAETTPTYIDAVEVELKTTVTMTGFPETLRHEIAREASRYPKAGAPHRMRIVVDTVRYKNPLLAATVGDGNYASAEVKVVDARSGETRAEYSVAAHGVNTAMNLGGVLDAVIQDRASADHALAIGLAADAMEKLYGTKAAAVARTRPAFAEIPPPAPAAPR